MTKLTWWFRIVGVFYLFLAALNLYGMFVDSAFFSQTLPYPAGENVVRAFMDG